MKSLDADKKSSSAKTVSADSEQDAQPVVASDNNGFFTPNEKIDFSNVKVEPLFEEEVDFDTFSKSDFRAVKVRNALQYLSQRSFYSLHLMTEQVLIEQFFPVFMLTMNRKNWLERH